MEIQNYKDCSPEETISKIRTILNLKGIFPYETAWINTFDHCHAVRLGIMGYPGMGVNGKGITKLYALASAYGELMERLQCGTLFKKSYGLMEDAVPYPPDLGEEKFPDSFEEQGHIISNIIPDFDERTIQLLRGSTFATAPYYDVKNKSIAIMPESFISISCGTNGMCAGNTPEEALVQGLSEIIERHVAKTIINAKTHLDLPDIQVGAVADKTLRKMIMDARGKGYRILIKDCTLGGVYPCLGILLINNESMKYTISLGAHPIFDIALQRCITEAFQTRSIENKMHPLFTLENLEAGEQGAKGEDQSEDVQAQFKLGAYKGTLDFINSSSEDSRYRKAFQETFISNKHSLEFLCSILEGQGYNIYIRDLSYLDFPTYRIYVGGMSEIYPIPTRELKFFFGMGRTIKKCLLNIKAVDPENLKKFTAIVDDLPGSSMFSRDDIFPMCDVMLKDNADLTDLTQNFDLLMSLIHYRLKEYKRSSAYLKAFLENNQDNVEDMAYFTCAYFFIKLMSENMAFDTIKEMFLNIFGDTTNQVLEDLSTPEDVFKYYTLPVCGECGSCPAKNDCYYKNWKKLTGVFVDSAKGNPIDQGRLSTLFRESN